MQPLIGIIMGSRSDWETMEHSAVTLTALEVPFEVRVVEPMGSHTLLTGAVMGQQVRVVAPSDARPQPGSMLQLRPLPDRISWMDAESGAALEAKR